MAETTRSDTDPMSWLYDHTTVRERFALMLAGFPFVLGFTAGLLNYSYNAVIGLYTVIGVIYLSWRVLFRLGLFARRKATSPAN